MKSYSSDVQRHLGALVVEKVWSERVAKLLEYASDVALARRPSKTTRLFAAVMPASPNTAASIGLFCSSVRPTFLDMYSVQFVWRCRW